MNFNLRAIDAYSLKAVASINGIGAPSTRAVVAELVAEAVINEIPRFQEQIQAYFNKMKTKGREMRFRFLLYEDAEITAFDEECGGTGKEYIEILDEWFEENSVNDTWDLEDDSDTRLEYSARLPMFSASGKKIRIKKSVKPIITMLEEQCGLENQIKLDIIGQGKAWFFIGPSKM